MAVCYEPSNDENESDIVAVYLYGKPTTLNEYLSKFEGIILIRKGLAYRVCKVWIRQTKYLE